ncbi:ABC transporter permease [Halobacillus litoralis]|uniref:ABC transporter permease n=1 Tax=Halobacillus litoralis TaxID=45668 RepID=UPI002492F704|nr:ABC transporter permease subunit [Halobacillus litoralis]
MKSFKNKNYYLFIPAVLFLTLPLYGFMNAIFHSLQTGGDWTFDYYAQLLQSDRFITSLWFSIRTALIATVISLIIGLSITRHFHGYLEKNAPRLLVWLPMLFPHFVWGYMVILLLSETGLAAQISVLTGVLPDTEAFPILTRDPNGIGIIITYVWKEIPLVILMLFPIYASIDPDYYDLVDTLGGNGWRRFSAVELPHLLPVLIETFLIVFSFTLSAYEVPALLGTTFPEMISVLGYEWFYGSSWDDRPLAFAAMVSVSIMLLISAGIGYLYLNKNRWKAMRGGR